MVGRMKTKPKVTLNKDPLKDKIKELSDRISLLEFELSRMKSVIDHLSDKVIFDRDL